MARCRRLAALLLAVAGLFVSGCETPAEPGGPAVPEAVETPAAKPAPAPAHNAAYPWLELYDPAESIEARIPVPPGYRRVPAAPGIFAAWLRGLPLKSGTPPIRLFNGQIRPSEGRHAAVVDIDVGARDLQQCADVVIRLRAEYLRAAGREDAIRFNFTSGDRCDWDRWAAGERPVVSANRVTWSRSAGADRSYAGFRRYLDVVFTYAGTLSLSGELRRVGDVRQVAIGDVFIHGGSPGHCVLVVDVATHRDNGRRVFLLAQGYMPAQDPHVLVNPTDTGLSPWFAADFGPELRTPDWTFQRGDLKRFASP